MCRACPPGAQSYQRACSLQTGFPRIIGPFLPGRLSKNSLPDACALRCRLRSAPNRRHLSPDAPLHVHFPANSVTVAPRSLAKLAEKCTMFGNRLHRQLVFRQSPGGFKAALVLTGLVYFVGNKGWKTLKGPSVRSGYPGCLMKNLNLQNFLHTAIIHGNGFCKFIHKPFLSQNRGNGI